MTLASGPLNVDDAWLKYCKLLFEYLRNVSAVLRARVQAFKKASFCSWCFVISWTMKAALASAWLSVDDAPEVGGAGGGPAAADQSTSSRLYSRSRLSRTEHTCSAVL